MDHPQPRKHRHGYHPARSREGRRPYHHPAASPGQTHRPGPREAAGHLKGREPTPSHETRKRPGRTPQHGPAPKAPNLHQNLRKTDQSTETHDTPPKQELRKAELFPAGGGKEGKIAPRAAAHRRAKGAKARKAESDRSRPGARKAPSALRQ